MTSEAASPWGDGIGRRPSIGAIAMPARAVRATSVALVVLWTWVWHVRATGSIAPVALALLAGIVLACLAFGRLGARLTADVVAWRPGVAYELLLGFFCGNTLLFMLTLVSPLGMGMHMGLIGIAALLAGWATRRRAGLDAQDADGEWGSLACIAFTGLATTLWVREQQPVMWAHDGLTTFRVWIDAFIHIREISTFAQAHGLATVGDIKLAGGAAPVYHFGSYMLPAALNALTSTSALDGFVAFQLPFGILLSGLAVYALTAVLFRRTWPAVVAAAVVVASPDAYSLFDIRFFSYHFMTQANLGMFYGLACIALAWIFMLEGCSNGRVRGVALAFVLLATCAFYKAHLFVANAGILMLYPCAFFQSPRVRLRVAWRVLAAAGVVALFVTVVVLAQRLPRMPVLRLDGSGLHEYINILMNGTRQGWLKHQFHRLYYEQHLPWLVNASLAGAVILFGSYAWWVILTPWAFWKARTRVAARCALFVAIVAVNYQVMAMFLALVHNSVGTPEEFVNRPHAWAWLVVVASGAACLAIWLRDVARVPQRRLGWIASVSGVLLLVFVARDAHDLQTFPEDGTRTSYLQFNTVPTCFVRAAQYARDHGRAGDVLQDSRFDPALVATAVSERQAYVIDSDFGGRGPLVDDRVRRIDALQAAGDWTSMAAWARDQHVDWYLQHPEDGVHWNAEALDRAVFRCDGYRLFSFDGSRG